LLLLLLLLLLSLFRPRIAQSVKRLTTDWKVRGSNPGGGEIFRAPKDRPWSPPSPLNNGYRLFTGVKRPRRGVDRPPSSSAEVKERVELFIYPHLKVFMARSRVKFTLLLLLLLLLYYHLYAGFYVTLHFRTFNIPYQQRHITKYNKSQTIQHNSLQVSPLHVSRHRSVNAYYTPRLYHIA